MMVSAQLLIAAAIAIIFIYIWKMRHFIYATFKINGPLVLPVLGNVLEYVGNNEDILQSIIRLVKTYGFTHRIWIGSKFMVIVTHPEDLKIILNHPNALQKDDFYSFLGEPLGLGQSLFTCLDVSRWRRNRKLIARTFSATILNSFIPIFEEQALVLCEKLGEMVGNGVFDVYPFVSHCHLDIVCETSMGVKLNVQRTHCEYTNWIDRSMEITFKRAFHPLYHYDCVFKWTKEGKESKYLRNCIRNYNDNIIKTRKQLHKENKTAQQKKVFIDHLIEISEKTGYFTDEDMSDEIALMIFGGTDTVTTTESFVFMMLGMHPEVQDKVFAEQEAIFGGDNRHITHEDIAQMKYLEDVIKETLRLFPVAPLVGRAITDEIELRDCVLPKGTSCFMWIYITQRNPEIWKDPLTFNPDRFLPENLADRHPYAWLPFSAGQRNCIGLRYGMMAMKVVVSMVVRRYKIYCSYSSVEEIPIKADVKLKAVDGNKISLQLRK